VPLGSLVENGLSDGRIDMVLWPEEIITAAKPDVIIWQRQVEDAQIDTIKRWRALLPDTVFIFELDDYLADIPESSFHASFMPPDIIERLRSVLPLCDRVTTTTQPLAKWLASLGGRDVRVAPNGLPQMRLRDRAPRLQGRLRIGWTGGMSHSGDLELLRPAMTEIGDNDVVWVFLGMQPENPACRIEFHEGVPVAHYLDAMASLDVDLLLAPLEDNVFNRNKSNLKLVEAACCGVPIIAQKLEPYLLEGPPVWTYATTPESWTEAIRSFLKETPARRKNSADALRSWVARKYTLEKLQHSRADNWLPKERWRPVIVSPLFQENAKSPIFCAADGAETAERETYLSAMPLCQEGLETACRTAVAEGRSVLWMRPATVLSETSWNELSAALAPMHETIASVIPLSNDGVNAFPRPDMYSPTPTGIAELLTGITGTELKGRRLQVPAPTGPVILLTYRALAALGIPDIDGCDGNEEQSILEWGCRAAARQWKHMQIASAFAVSAIPPTQPTQQAVTRLQARGWGDWLQVKTEKLSEDEREAIEIALLRQAWNGPRPGFSGFTSEYDEWRLMCEAKESGLARYGGKPLLSEIIAVRRFGEPARSPASWVVFVDDTIKLSDYALQYFYQAVSEASHDVHIIYADHETVFQDNKTAPELKPDYDHELFLAQDYITSLCAVRSIAIEGAIPGNRSDLYKLCLRTAAMVGCRGFLHIPQILGSKQENTSPEALAMDAFGRKLIIEEVYGEKIHILPHRNLPGALIVTYDWRKMVDQPPLVSIVIPTLGGSRQIQPCVATVLQHTAYPNYEIIVLQNGEKPEPELLPATRDHSRVRVVRYSKQEDFNWSRLNNWGITQYAQGDYILALNDDINISTLDRLWLDRMLAQALQPDVGVVGARLLHPYGVMQHCGVVTQRGIAGHMHKMLQNGQPGSQGRALLSHEASAVTGACMLFARDTFNRIGGFDERLSHNYGDTLFCLAARKLGLRVVVEMAAEMLHPESSTRPAANSPEGIRKLYENGKILAAVCPERDPYWSPSLSLQVAPGSMGIEGLNADRLAWQETLPVETAQRILVVNDTPGRQGKVLDILAEGNVPLCADLSGFKFKLTSPSAVNIRTWDTRQPEPLVAGIKALGVHQVILRSMVGASDPAWPIAAFDAFALLRGTGISFVTDPVDPSLLMPWLPSAEPRKTAENFGFVNIEDWFDAWSRATGSEAALAAQ
jgi:GT2 family glycosyltransferase